MVDIGFLASTALMGILLVAVAAALGRTSGRRGYAVGAGESTDYEAGGTIWAAYDRVAGVAGRETVWIGAFLVLVVALMAMVALFLAGGATGTSVGPALGALIALVLVAYLVGGTYRMLRVRRRPRSEAVAVSAWTAGMVFLAVVALNLVLGI